MKISRQKSNTTVVKYGNPTTWRTYEEVAQYLLDQMASHFSLGRVEGKQIIPGESGVKWEIDAKGVLGDGEGFLVIECRRYPKSRLKKSAMTHLAYVIRDVGATGGITVSPLEPQSGAKLIASRDNIKHARLNPDSTTENYVLQFLNKAFVGVHIETEISASAEKTRAKQESG